jgi:hypothetical protein
MMKSQGLYKGPDAHTNWSPCAVDTECALGFERKIPDCDGCDDHFCPQGPDQATYNSFQHPSTPQPNPNCTCPQPTELAELFNGIHYESNGGRLQDSATLEQKRQSIATVLNVTDYNTWLMLTTFTGNEDTGWHNYYLYRPAPGGLWRVINYDGDWSLGHLSQQMLSVIM